MFTEDTMTRINTNVSSMLAQRVLVSQNKGLVTSLERLSTGLSPEKEACPSKSRGRKFPGVG